MTEWPKHSLNLGIMMELLEHCKSIKMKQVVTNILFENRWSMYIFEVFILFADSTVINLKTLCQAELAKQAQQHKVMYGKMFGFN